MKSDQLEKQFKVYAELAKKDKSIDVTSLMINALDTHTKDADFITAGQKRWAYIISLGAPPLGLFFFVKFWFSGKEDGHDAAWICLVLTAVSIMIMVILSKVLLSGSGAQLEQIQQLTPKDIQQFSE